MRRESLGVALLAILGILAACTSDDTATKVGTGPGNDGGPTTSEGGVDASDPGDSAATDAPAPADAADAALCTPPGAPIIVFLDKAGGMWTPGADDSRTNVSSILNQSMTIPAWGVAPAYWATLFACVAQKFKLFNINVTDVDPGAAAHIEVVFAPGNLALFSGGGANSPSTCAVIPNSVAYVSTTYADANLDNGCAAAASVVGFSLGLESVTACPDAMSNSQASCATAGFTNVALACGTTAAAACTCQAGSTQNSFARLLAVAGPGCL